MVDLRRHLRTLVACLLLPAAVVHAQGTTVFRHVAVVDVASGTVQVDMDVEVASGRITSVQAAAAFSPTDSAIVVDGRGRFLIPGLWDSHVHLTKLGEKALPVFLANGVTSVRDMGSDLTEVARWRAEIETGARSGPRIRTSGPILESRTNVDRMKRDGTVEPVDRLRVPVGTPAEAEAAVARLVAGGADLIKVRTVASVGTLRAIAAAARAHGKPLAGHPAAAPEVLIDIGLGSVEHMLTFPPMRTDPEPRRALFERLRAAGLAFGSSLVNLDGSMLVPYNRAIARLASDPLRRFVSPYLASDWREQVEEKKGAEAEALLAMLRTETPELARDIREMHAAGVRVLAGSDAAVVFMYPGFSLHDELEVLVRTVGLTPAAALRAATINPAAFFGLDDELGAVRVGFRADLVLIAGNPLSDIRHTREIVGVVRDGRWLDRPALDAPARAGAS